MDKRIIKTTNNIKLAFMELVGETVMSKISVSDLAAKAKVNRSTFYLHYDDVADVAADIEKEIAETISDYIDAFTVADVYNSTYALFTGLTKRLDENEPMKRYLFFSTNSSMLISKLKDMFVEKTKTSVLNRFTHLTEKDIAYPLIFVAAGIVDCYAKWVRGDKTDIGEAIREISKITEKIINDYTA